MALILDTNALSAYADGASDVFPHVKAAARLAVPVIVLGEYRLGIMQSRNRESYEAWLLGWIPFVDVLDVDEETTKHYSYIGHVLRQKGRPIPTNDLWIAALCRQHKLPLLSRDHHFDAVPGLQRLSW